MPLYIIKQQDTKMYRAVKIQFFVFGTSGLDGDEWSGSFSSLLIPR
jgi:hypothetical protein